MNQDCLIIINAPFALEDAIVDCLLALEVNHGFTSMPVNMHHHHNQGLSLSEQVSGRQKQICFQVQIDVAGAKTLLSRLQENFSGSGLVYKLLPLQQSGTI
jgi:Protein of unknown function (DUF3240)